MKTEEEFLQIRGRSEAREWLDEMGIILEPTGPELQQPQIKLELTSSEDAPSVKPGEDGRKRAA